MIRQKNQPASLVDGWSANRRLEMRRMDERPAGQQARDETDQRPANRRLEMRRIRGQSPGLSRSSSGLRRRSCRSDHHGMADGRLSLMGWHDRLTFLTTWFLKAHNLISNNTSTMEWQLARNMHFCRKDSILFLGDN